MVRCEEVVDISSNERCLAWCVMVAESEVKNDVYKVCGVKDYQ